MKILIILLSLLLLISLIVNSCKSKDDYKMLDSGCCPDICTNPFHPQAYLIGYNSYKPGYQCGSCNFRKREECVSVGCDRFPSPTGTVPEDWVSGGRCYGC